MWLLESLESSGERFEGAAVNGAGGDDEAVALEDDGPRLLALGAMTMGLCGFLD